VDGEIIFETDFLEQKIGWLIALGMVWALVLVMKRHMSF